MNQAKQRAFGNEKSVQIPIDGRILSGDLNIPGSARGIILFAHGSGSSRLSPRNRYVAQELQKAALATLLMDLLTSEEEEMDARTGTLRFDIELLAHRLLRASLWLKDQQDTGSLRVGYFGASTAQWLLWLQRLQFLTSLRRLFRAGAGRILLERRCIM